MEKPSSLSLELDQNAFAPVVVDIGPSDYQEAMRCYMEFLQLPEDVKSSTIFMLDPARRNTQFGWDQKARSKGNLDNKDVFHFGSKMRQNVEHRLLHPPRALLEFTDAAEEIYYSAAHALKKACYELDEHAAGLVGLHFPAVADWNHHLRFIAYYPTEDQTLAAGHFDQSTLTLALAESHSGLRIGTEAENLQMVRHRAGQGLLFTGKGWDKLATQVDVPPLQPAWHDVVRTPDQGVDTQVLRWAIVLFANPAQLDTTLTVEETHSLAS